MDRVFLDANVLFSAAYASKARLQRLWRRENTTLLTSPYALDEARRNLTRPAQKARLTRLMRSVTLVAEPAEAEMPEGIVLPVKDRPILLAAVEAGATHLVTGDVTHFGRYYSSRIRGVLVLPPADYLAAREANDDVAD